jgi:D-alanyl-D-alanine carboxypeptidase
MPNEITLVHLLRHTSGLGDYGPLAEYHNAVRSQPSQPWTRQQFCDVVLSKGMLFAPGDGWAYSNIGYMMLLQIMEQATGQCFANTLESLVTTPLGLQRTFVLERIEDWSTCAPGYGHEVGVDGRSVDVRAVYHPGWCAPGVVASTAEEVTAVFDALLAGKILRTKTLSDMLTLTPIPGHHPPGISPGCGMGILSDCASPKGRNYGHGGRGPGYDLDVTVFPDSPLGRLTVATFVNTSSGPRAEECQTELLSRLLGDAV